MFDALPFQIQGIPTLTMYEHGAPGRRVYESGLVSAPGLSDLRPGTPIDDSISEPDTLNGQPALSGAFLSPAVDQSISDSLNTRPTFTGFVFIAPVDEAATESGLDSGPAFANVVVNTPVDRATSESTTLNGQPALSGMIVT